MPSSRTVARARPKPLREPLAIRLAEPADADGLADLHVRSWRAAYRGLVPDAFLDALSVPERALVWRALLHRADARHTWVAERSGRLAGFVSFGVARDADAPPDVGEVYALYAEPDWCGTGIGTSVLAHAESELRLIGHAAARLWVLVGNTPAIGFYERRGWRPDEATKAEPLRPGGPEHPQLRMAKRLRPASRLA